MSKQSFFAELMKRKVVQVAAIYGAVAWGLTEGIVTIVQQLFLPQWVSTLSVIGFVVGFPIAMFLAWTFDLTPEGIRRTDVSSRRGTASIALSMLLLVAGTGGLFLLIQPAIDATDTDILPNSVAVMPFDDLATGGKPDTRSIVFPPAMKALKDGEDLGLVLVVEANPVVGKGKSTDVRPGLR